MSIALRLQNPMTPPAAESTTSTYRVRHAEAPDAGYTACEAPDAGYSRSVEAPDAGYSRSESMSAVFSHGRSQS